MSNIFRKSFLASLATMSSLANLNAEEEIIMSKGAYNVPDESVSDKISPSTTQEIVMNRETYNNLGTRENISNENSLSFVQRHPKKLIAAGIFSGAILKQPTKDLLRGIVFPALKSLNNLSAPTLYGPMMRKMLGQNFSEIQPAKIIQQGAGSYWCWIASLQGVLNTLGYKVKQEDLYRLTHLNLEAATIRPDGTLDIPAKNPAFFEGNRNNPACVCSDALITGMASGSGFDLLAKTINRDLNGYRVLILREKESNMTALNLELIIRSISKKLNGGWFCISDPITLRLVSMGHTIMCKLDGENLLFENCIGPIAYSMNIKKWCEISSEIINQAFNAREYTLNSSCLFEAFGFTREKIKNQIIYTLTNNGGLDIYEH